MSTTEQTSELRDLLHARQQATSGRARQVREAAGLSRAEMARELRVAEVTLRSWETGTRRPTGDRGARWGALLRWLEEATAAEVPA